MVDFGLNRDEASDLTGRPGNANKEVSAELMCDLLEILHDTCEIDRTTQGVSITVKNYEKIAPKSCW